MQDHAIFAARNCCTLSMTRRGTNKDSHRKVRQAFFHGLLTGYAVALKLR